MRDQPTKAEVKITQAISKAFQKEGHSIILPSRKVNDKPDILLEVNGIRVACECTQIPPSYILQHYHKRHKTGEWPDGKIVSQSFPNEPHIWVADAILKKVPLVPEYLSRTSAKEAWLIVHTPETKNQNFLNYDKTWIPWALRHGSKMVKHPFTQMFIWSPQIGIQTISILKNETGTYSELGIDFSNGYPTLNSDRMRFRIVTTKNKNAKPIIFHYAFDSRISKFVEPKDDEYKKHAPSTRNAKYYHKALIWEDRAEVSTTIKLSNPNMEMKVKPQFINGLSPNTEYFYDFLYEFRAPTTLNTFHVIQPVG